MAHASRLGQNTLGVKLSCFDCQYYLRLYTSSAKDDLLFQLCRIKKKMVLVEFDYDFYLIIMNLRSLHILFIVKVDLIT